MASKSSKVLNTLISIDSEEVTPPLPDAMTVTVYVCKPVTVNRIEASPEDVDNGAIFSL